MSKQLHEVCAEFERAKQALYDARSELLDAQRTFRHAQADYITAMEAHRATLQQYSSAVNGTGDQK